MPAPVVKALGGKRADLGFYVRSRMEANYARYLKWLKGLEQIEDWSYEPQEWAFPIKRGPARFYKTDFWIKEKTGKTYYVEVKGYMDRVSRTKLRRMAKYHPEVPIKIVGRGSYAAIRKYASLIPGWETET